MKEIHCLAIVGLLACATLTRAATFTVTNTASDGPGSFSQALRDANASVAAANTINFNIPGPGPFYIVPPVGGFPLVYHDNTTIDGTTQSGWVANTAPITQTNNAVIRIVLDARGLPIGNFRDMAYVYYGTKTTNDPAIDNSSMWSATLNQRERGGYDPEDNGDVNPYAPGEVAILGIYRSQNVTVKGLALLGTGPAHAFYDHAIAVAQDYGYDTTVHNVPNTDVGRLTYENGTSRGLRVQGCWFGVDPLTGDETAGSSSAIAFFKHRDKSSGGTRPDLANGQNFVIGVAPGSANPRAEFNVFSSQVLSLAAEAVRVRVSGNQFLDAPPEFGLYDDTQIPSILFGTDGDGVNDADEGNLFVSTTGADLQTHYFTGNKLWVYAGNYFGLLRDGSHVLGGGIENAFRFDQSTRVRFGSDFRNGVYNPLEANHVFDTLGFFANVGAPDAAAWISLRGNVLSNNPTMPFPLAPGTVYSRYMATPYRPVITTATVASMTVTYGVEIAAAPVKRVFVDLYKSDPQGDVNSDPEGLDYLGSYEDTTLGDGTVTWPSPPYAAGDRVVVAVHYARCLAVTPPTITGVNVTASPGNVVLTWTGTACDYDIQRRFGLNDPWGSVGGTYGNTFTTPVQGSTAFYRIVGGAGTGGQTSPFAFYFDVVP